MKSLSLIVGLFLIGSTLLMAQDFTMEQVTSYPFPSELTSSSGSDKIAWAINRKGERNIWVAQAPGYQPRQLTDYTRDDGQEISSLSISADGKWVVYVRGGDHGGGNADIPVNAASDPIAPKVEVGADSRR